MMAWEKNEIGPNTVGRDSWVHFSLSNSEDFTTNKIQNVRKVNLRPLSLSFSRLIINMSHLFKWRHRENVLENFSKFISQERNNGIWTWGVYSSYFKVLVEWQLGLFSKYDLKENRYYDFSRKISISFMFFYKIWVMKDVCKMPRIYLIVNN